MTNKRFSSAMIVPNWGTAYWWTFSVVLAGLAAIIGLAYAVH